MLNLLTLEKHVKKMMYTKLFRTSNLCRTKNCNIFDISNQWLHLVLRIYISEVIFRELNVGHANQVADSLKGSL